jgi:hypothetical protein
MQKGKVFPGRIIFDHMPKTGGQAINAWLVEALGTGCVTDNLIGDHRDLIRRYGGLYSIISGHVNFEDGEGLDPRIQYLTLLREPVDRTVSWLYFLINNHDDNSHLAGLIESGRRFLDSEGQDVPDQLRAFISNWYVDHFCRIYGRAFECDDKRFANALAAIQLYDVVGVYEALPQFLADVAVLIGLPAPKAIPRRNVTSQRLRVDQLSPALRERIVALNQLDLRLYEQVVAWKASTASQKPPKPLQVTTPGWQKFEPVRDRVILTPDVFVAGAVLREGHDIHHRQLMTFDVDFFLAREIRDLQMGIHIFDSDRCQVFGTNSTMLGQSHRSVPRGSFRVSHHLLADLPTGKYTAGFAFTEILPEGGKQLTWVDALCEFYVYPPTSKKFTGSTYIPAEMNLCPNNLAGPDAVVANPTGCLRVVTPASPMSAGTITTVGVKIANQSEQIWRGDIFRPINFSYHWLRDSGEVLVYSGLRTPLPKGGVEPGMSLAAEIKVEPPLEAGKHTLVLTMVQERVGWFENMGFEPARVEVEVRAI